MRRLAATVALMLSGTAAYAQPSSPSGAPSPSPASPGPTVTASPSTPDELFAETLRAYHAALSVRRLGQMQSRKEDVAARVAEGEDLMAAGRVDEAIARLVDLIESPSFALYADSDAGRAAVFRLGDALAEARIFGPARGYLRRSIMAKEAWADANPWARRAVRRLVDVALQSEDYAAAAADLAAVPANAPEEVRGEIAYLTGRAQEAAGNPAAALVAYARVTQRCRFWAQATYLSALIDVEKGNYKDGENLLCKVADPKRSAATTPVFADEKFFAVRDLARLGLGRIAHEERRNDDARYYYYLVPRDSDRLAEALYEGATTRYEKKDYDGARQLLDELVALGIHHRYEDEAWVLDAWVDLARCQFADADKKLVTFVARYEPVRDAARRIATSGVSMQRLLTAAHSGTDAAGAEVGGATPDVVRTIAALVRVDPAYGRIVARRDVLEREASGLVNALGAVSDMQRALANAGGVRATVEEPSDSTRKARQAQRSLDGLQQQAADIEAAHPGPDQVASIRQELVELRARVSVAQGTASAETAERTRAAGADLPDLLRADASFAAGMQGRIAASRKELEDEETALAKDALRRLDLRLSRLLRRARLGRIESVLGRKRALEVEVEAIRLGYLPKDAVDSLDAARYLEDNEEYWPFEGDDWPDEYVGAEKK